MGQLFKAVNMVNEKKKEIVISQLLELGVTGDGGVNLHQLEYDDLKNMLVMEKIRRS